MTEEEVVQEPEKPKKDGFFKKLKKKLKKPVVPPENPRLE